MPITTQRTLEPSAAIDESYRYQPLNTDRPVFRLLRLRKGYWTPIECDILHESLDQPTQPYEALSYTWGNPNRNQMISVNGSNLAITSSLLLTLIHLRYRDKDRILWVDGICIDQTNLVERGQQVQQMGEIYRSAERVIFWLGPATDQTAILMHSIRVFEEESDSHDCSDWKLGDPRWMEMWEKVQSRLQVRYEGLIEMQKQGLEDLLGRPWFARVWIVQEVANARSGLICCGTNAVSAHLFALMPRVLGVPTDQLSQAVLDMMPGPSRLETWWADKRDMYSLLRYLGPRQSSEPRDIVYALRGISTDASTPGTLEPNYEASVEDVVRQISQHLYFCDVNAEEMIVGSIERLVANVTKLNSVAIGQLIKTSRKKQLGIILERGEIVISAETIRTASKGGRDWMDLLCYVVGRGASVLPDAIPEAIDRADLTTLKVLLDCFKNTQVTPPLIEQAALNEQYGSAMLYVLSQRGPLPPLKTMWMDQALSQVSSPQVKEAMFEIWNNKLLEESPSMSHVAEIQTREDQREQQLDCSSEHSTHPPVTTPRQTYKDVLRGRFYSLVRLVFYFMFFLYFYAILVYVTCEVIYSGARIYIERVLLPHFELNFTHISCAVINRSALGNFWVSLRKENITRIRGNLTEWGCCKMRWFSQHKAVSIGLICARLRDSVVKIHVIGFAMIVNVLSHIIFDVFKSVFVLWFVFACISLR